MPRRNLRRFSAALSSRGLCFDLTELGDAIDEPGDILAEQSLDLLGRCESVLDGVVKYRCRDRLVASSFRSVRIPATSMGWLNILTARSLHLGAVRLHREDVGTVDQIFVSIGVRSS